MPGALSHIRVLDLTRILAGPWCTQILADLGAEVIKIERPGGGDDTRSWGPPYLKDTDGNDTRESAYYLSCNRGKKSVALDVSTHEGQDIVRKLASQSDLLIENYKVGGLRQYGLDYESLKAVNPRLIYCSITGFGQTGPYASNAGYDFIIQAMGGMMSITGERDDLPGGGPQKVGVAVSDLMTGMYATVALLAALAHRERTGEGQYIDMALLDSEVAMVANLGSNYLVSGKAPGRMGNAHQNIVPYQAFATADGHMILAVGNDNQFSRFCSVAGRPELAQDPRFATNPNRVRNRPILVPVVAEIMRTRTTRQWPEALEPAGVPVGPINNLAQVFEDPQVRARGMKVEAPHPLAGKVPMVASPMKLSATPVEHRTAPPTLGQHTDEILTALLGFTEQKIAQLRERGVV
jgi:glutaryl-CoA transferase